MSSERARWLALLLAAAGACADFSRGDPSPDGAAIDTTGPAVEAGGGEGGPALRSFARDVHPLLIDGCARCHSASGQASDSDLLFTMDAGRDLTVVARFVDTSNPAGSRLLIKGAGTGHGGGAIFAAGTPEYRTILEWISQGSAP